MMKFFLLCNDRGFCSGGCVGSGVGLQPTFLWVPSVQALSVGSPEDLGEKGAVYPLWPKLGWFSLLKALGVEAPLLFSVREDLLQQRCICHPHPGMLKLGQVSGVGNP